ncbi:hypothetical protein ANANG_G00174020 [Anguilla anguilla]|uniref:Ig-like domain-containing protein n=1 Tax=Anguilla anguilla TaxID=7936 RepID=A0A9D3M5G4_ANGAN|nr:hypothetical protein ANANG_G00174020 [Anguilla anguilla]
MFNDAAVHVCVLYLVLGCTLAQITHPKSWLMAKTARSARIECVVDKNVNLASTPIHWYQHREGDAFRRVLYIPAGSANGKNDDGFSGFIGSLISKDRKSILTISNVNTNDAASYHCAYYDGHCDDLKRKCIPKLPLHIHISIGHVKYDK